MRHVTFFHYRVIVLFLVLVVLVGSSSGLRPTSRTPQKREAGTPGSLACVLRT